MGRPPTTARHRADGWTVDDVRATTSISNLAPDGIAAWLATCTRI